MKDIKRIIFVCTGNTCRSPMAEGIARAEAARRGLPLEFSSAGTGAFPDEPASEHSVQVCCEIDVDISAHRARPVGEGTDDEHTLFAVMTPRHMSALVMLAAVPPERIVLLGSGIPDPYGQPEEVYRAARDAIYAAVCALLDEIERGMEETPEEEILLRPMEPSDIEAVAAMEAEGFSDAWTAGGFAEELENPLADFIVAEYNGEVCGYAGIISAGGISELPKIYVAPLFRRKGAAKSMLNGLEALARVRGSEQLTLEVRVSNAAAIALYEKQGFERIGIRPNFYSSPAEDALIMTKTL